MKLQIFNGGKNVRQAAHLLAVNEAVAYTNIDNESSTLKAVKKKAATGVLLDEWAYYFKANGTWESSVVKRHYLEYQADLYYTEIGKVPKYFDGSIHYLLGIFQAGVKPTVATALGVQTGTYTYVFTYYNSVKDIESQPSPVSDEIVVTSQGVRLTNLSVSSDSQVDKKRIYRVGGDLGRFSLVDTINNTTTVYNDSLSDVDIDGALMNANDYDQCLPGMKYLTEAYGIMFGALGDKLYFSIAGQPTYWPSTNFIGLPVEITGIAAINIGVLVFTAYKTYIITGTSQGSFAKRLFSGDQGCAYFESIQYAKNTLFWASSDGICVVDGTQVKVLSREKLGSTTLAVVNSAFYNEVYYALKVDGSILAYDFRYGTLLKELTLDITNIIVAEDILYGYKTDTYFSLFAHEDSESFDYTSPKLSDGSLTLRKVYKSIFIYSSGSVTVKVFIDGIERASRTFTTTDSHEVKVKEEYKNGYHIQFKLSGTGEVTEIDYTVGAFEK